MKATKKKRLILVLVIAAVAVCAAILLLHFRGNTLRSMDDVGEITGKEVVRASQGNDGNRYSMDINETGCFFVEDYLMKYCDYESGETYILCDKANCMHMDSKCGAFVGDASGIGFYNGKMYGFIKNTVNNCYELTEMSLTGQDRRVIATLDLGEYEVGCWRLVDLAYNDYHIYYAYGKAFVETEELYEKSESNANAGFSYGHADELSKQSLLMIDLETGDMQTIAESEGCQGYQSMIYELIDENKVIYTVQETSDVLNGKELEDAILNGEINDLEEMYDSLDESVKQDFETMLEAYEDITRNDELYFFYQTYAVFQLTKRTAVTYSYDMATGETTELYRSDCPVLYDEAGVPSEWQTPYVCLGWYGDGFIVESATGESHEAGCSFELLRWDESSGQLESLLQVDNAIIPGMQNWRLVDGDKIVYIVYNDDGETGKLYVYNLSDQTSTYLFDDQWTVTLRFLGETDEYFICEKYTDETQSVVRIAKDDYFAGNLDAAVKIMDWTE